MQSTFFRALHCVILQGMIKIVARKERGAPPFTLQIIMLATFVQFKVLFSSCRFNQKSSNYV